MCWPHSNSRSSWLARRRPSFSATRSPNGRLERSAKSASSLPVTRPASADRITAVVPFLCYSRKERKTKSRDPVTTRYVAGLFEAVGVDRVVTLEVHNVAAFQNAFRCRTEHLEAHLIFAQHFAAKLGERELAVVSPDVGGIKRADRFREILSRRLGREVSGAFVEKRRSAGIVSGEALVGDVADRTVLLIDDMICGGTTLARAAKACRKGRMLPLASSTYQRARFRHFS